MSPRHLAFILALGWCATATASTLAEKNGNIFLFPTSGRQLTSSGRDAQPTLSPDKRLVAFIRTTSGSRILTPRGEVDPQEIWVVGIDGKHARRLVRSMNPEPEGIMSSMADLFLPEFSVDGRVLYFMSGCSMVESCLHKVDVHTRQVQALGHANGMEVLRSGRHAGYLLVQKHQYYPSPDGGSFEEIWLVSPAGEPVQDLGPGEFAPGFDKTIVRFKEADSRSLRGARDRRHQGR